MYPSMRMIDNGHIRKCLWPMQEMAADQGIALVVLAHTNKGGYADPLDRLSGGRAIGGSARAVWYLGQQDRESDLYHMAPVKVNDFKPEPAIEYRIVGLGPDMPGVMRWGEVSEDVSAWDLDQPPKPSGVSKADRCADWMRDQLEDDPIRINDLKTEASKAEFGDHVFKKAKAMLGVEVKAGKGSAPPVYWACLPGQEPPVTGGDPSVTLQTPDHLGSDSELLGDVGVVQGSRTTQAPTAHP